MGKKSKAAAPIKDARFAHVHEDIRFKNVVHAQKEITTDERFKRMYEDEDAFQVDSRVDIRGRDIDIRGGTTVESSSESDQEDIDITEQLSDEEEVEENIPEIQEETARLAVLNCDWDNVKVCFWRYWP